jgi:hypothetical protein
MKLKTKQDLLNYVNEDAGLSHRQRMAINRYVLLPLFKVERWSGHWYSLTQAACWNAASIVVVGMITALIFFAATDKDTA